jgi:hypothetical protein
MKLCKNYILVANWGLISGSFARQVLYHLGHVVNYFCFGLFFIWDCPLLPRPGLRPLCLPSRWLQAFTTMLSLFLKEGLGNSFCLGVFEQPISYVHLLNSWDNRSMPLHSAQHPILRNNFLPKYSREAA